jgi:hypothetical protein
VQQRQARGPPTDPIESNLTAIDRSRATKKYVHLRYPNVSGTLATGGGLEDQRRLGLQRPADDLRSHRQAVRGHRDRALHDRKHALDHTPELKGQRNATVLYGFGRFAERGDRLVDGESGIIRRNLEEDATGLEEVDGAEVLSVLLRGRFKTMFVAELRRHLGLCRIVLGAKRDVRPAGSPWPHEDRPRLPRLRHRRDTG